MEKNNQQEGTQHPVKPSSAASSWNTRYLASITGISAIWLVAYLYILPASQWITYDLFGIAASSKLGASLQFFFYDTAKILLLLVAMVYVIAWARASLNVERVRDFLTGKRKGIGYLFGSGFGAITPFCSCSSIPLFLGFTTANIPIGITMAFLITSPLINEIAIVLLWGLLGWKFTLVYVTVGMLAGIVGGYFMDSIKAERWLQPFLKKAMENAPGVHSQTGTSTSNKMSVKQRHEFAFSETSLIAKRVWIWVIIGVGLGASLHGFVPETFFTENLGAGEWWSVPLSVLIGIPLYSNVTGVIPIMESLIMKGLPIGTTLAFCMSTVAASLPEVLMLKQVMQWKLVATFLGYLLVIFTLIGWLFNLIWPLGFAGV